jgi:sulfopyruvate decarboxylase alpha subunit
MATPWVPQVWQALLDHDVRQVAFVPDAGLAPLIELARAEPAVTTVPLSTEEEGVALAAGAWLGGRRSVLLMQSSGVGNCVNMLSLARTCRFPLLMLVTMRGQWGERNPWQVPMGSTTRTVLETAGALVFEADTADDVAPAVDAAAAMVFTGPAAAAVLVGQRVLGAKAFVAATATGTGATR